MSEHVLRSRFDGMRLTTFAAIMLLSAVLAIDHAQLRQLKQAVSTSDTRAQLGQTNSQLSTLREQIDTLLKQPQPTSEAQFNAARTDWERRLTRLQESLQGAAAAGAVESLDDRVAVIERRLARSQRPRTPSSGIPQSAVSPDPPFTPLAIERRGGEHVLSVLPAGSRSLAQARLLRVGEQEGAWLLERLDERVAHFRVSGQAQRVNVP